MGFCHTLIQEIKRPLMTNTSPLYKYLHTGITLPPDLFSLIRLMTGLPTTYLIKLIFQHLNNFLWVLYPPLTPYLQSTSSRTEDTPEVRALDWNSSYRVKRKLIFQIEFDAISCIESLQTSYRSHRVILG